MKQTNTCPKCGSHEIIKPRFTATGHKNAFQVVPLSTFKAVLIEKYICAKCGYVENYVDDTKGLKDLQEKYK